MNHALSRRLLCFGDSNTWGFNPAGGRYPSALCWPEQLARQLNCPLQVEGKPGRTLCYERATAGLISGFAEWQQCLQSQPTRIVLALGINDLAAGATPEQCQQALEHYLQAWQTHSPTAKLVLVSPAPLGPLTAGWQKLFQGQERASQKLGPLWAATALRWNIPLYRTTDSFCPGSDGLHWRAEFHQELAEALALLMSAHERLVSDNPAG